MWKCEECGTVNGEVLPKIEKKPAVQEDLEKSTDDGTDATVDSAVKDGIAAAKDSEAAQESNVDADTAADADVAAADVDVERGDKREHAAFSQPATENAETIRLSRGDVRSEDNSGTLRNRFNRATTSESAPPVTTNESNGSSSAQPVTQTNTTRQPRSTALQSLPDTRSLDLSISLINVTIVMLLIYLCTMLYDRLW